MLHCSEVRVAQSKMILLPRTRSKQYCKLGVHASKRIDQFIVKCAASTVVGASQETKILCRKLLCKAFHRHVTGELHDVQVISFSENILYAPLNFSKYGSQCNTHDQSRDIPCSQTVGPNNMELVFLKRPFNPLLAVLELLSTVIWSQYSFPTHLNVQMFILLGKPIS